MFFLVYQALGVLSPKKLNCKKVVFVEPLKHQPWHHYCVDLEPRVRAAWNEQTRRSVAKVFDHVWPNNGWVMWKAIYNVMVLTSKLIHTQLVCKRGSLQLFASQPSRTKLLYQDNILLVSKEDGHDVKQLHDEQQHMATDCLADGYKYKISIQSFESVVLMKFTQNLQTSGHSAPPSPE